MNTAREPTPNTAPDKLSLEADSMSDLNNRCPLGGSEEIRKFATVRTYNPVQTFRCFDDTDFPNGDLYGIIAYSLRDCAQACATLNNLREIQGKSAECIGVSLSNSVQQSVLNNRGANCWLKGNINGGERAKNSTSLRLCTTKGCEELPA